MNRIIKVDFSAGKVDLIELPEEDLRNYIGGSGIGGKILWDRRATS